MPALLSALPLLWSATRTQNGPYVHTARYVQYGHPQRKNTAGHADSANYCCDSLFVVVQFCLLPSMIHIGACQITETRKTRTRGGAAAVLAISKGGPSSGVLDLL